MDASKQEVTAMQTSEGLNPVAAKRQGLTADEFDRLYLDQWSHVLSYVRLRVGDADGHDIAAEAFTRAWSHKDAYDEDRGSSEAWLWTIVRNATIDHLRRVAAAPSSEFCVDRGPEELEGRVATQLETERTLGAVRALPEADRELIALRFGAGLTNRAIGEMLSMTEGNVAVRLHRALRRVRAKLEPEQEA